MKDRLETRAARLVRLYPRRWREQFPDFEEILAVALAENPRGVRRDVVRTAVAERLRDVGLVPRRPDEGARSGVALIYSALVPFAGLAFGMGSQLHTGLAPLGAATPSTLRTSDVLLTVAMPVSLVALPVAVFVLVAGARKVRDDPGTKTVAQYWLLARPALAFTGALGLLTAAGWGADRSSWYSPAAAALPDRGPGHVATLWVRGIVASITPAWIHPTLFARMPTGELAAALLGPVAALVAAAALFLVIVRVPLRVSRRANVVPAAASFVLMVVSVVACGRWLLDHPTREGGTSLQARSDQLAPGHTGWIVVSILAVLTVVASVGLRRLLRGRPDDPTNGGRQGAPRPVTDPAVAGGPVPL